MRTHIRTPQQRDRRFARARRLTQTVFVGAGAMSAVLVGYAAANAKPMTTVTTPTNIATSASTKSSSTPGVTVPATAPVTTTTVCTTTPSGTVTCY
jgi:phosphoribosylcarboxyaminoimidazole (NCAIR) mutase